MNNTVKSTALNYGLYLGLILALLTGVAYAVKLDLLANMWFGIAILILIIALGIVSIAKSKSQLNGFISFKDAFTSYFITVLVGLLLSTVVSYLLFNVIDPEAAKTLKEITIENTVVGMERWNVPQEAITEAVEKMRETNDYALGNLAKGLGIYLAIFSIIGLICAAVMKKNDPEKA